MISIFAYFLQSRPSTVQPSGSPQHNIPAPVVPQQYLATSQASSYLDNRDINKSSSPNESSPSKEKHLRETIGDNAGSSNDLSPTEERRSSLHRRSGGNDMNSHNNGNNVTNNSSSITNSGASNGTKRTNSPALNHIIYPLLSEVNFNI